MQTTKCPFCKIEEHQILYHNDAAVAIKDKYPVQHGHMLIIPKRHVESYFELTEIEILALHQLLQLCKREIDEKYKPDGYNVGVNVGHQGGQTVFHVHMHLIPRYKGDIEDPRGGIRKAIPNVVPYP